METVLVVDVIELYSIIIGLIIFGLIVFVFLLYWLWDEYLSYTFYKLKKKIKKV